MVDTEAFQREHDRIGLYGELFMLAKSSEIGKPLNNLTNDSKARKGGYDFSYKDKGYYDAKTDEIAPKTGNFPDELGCQAKDDNLEAFLNALKDKNIPYRVNNNDVVCFQSDYQTIKKLSEKYFVIGCCEKLINYQQESNKECYLCPVNVDEDEKRKDSFRLTQKSKVEPFYKIDVKKMDEWVKSQPVLHFAITKLSPEENEDGSFSPRHNLLILVKFSKLVNEGIAEILSSKFQDERLNKIFNDYHTTDELIVLLKEIIPDLEL